MRKTKHLQNIIICAFVSVCAGAGAGEGVFVCEWVCHVIFSLRPYVLCLVIFGFFCDKSFNRRFNFVSARCFRFCFAITALRSLSPVSFHPWLVFCTVVFHFFPSFSPFFSSSLCLLALIHVCYNYTNLVRKHQQKNRKENSWFSFKNFCPAGHEMSIKINKNRKKYESNRCTWASIFKICSCFWHNSKCIFSAYARALYMFCFALHCLASLCPSETPNPCEKCS